MILRTKALSHRKAQKARSRLQTANPQLAASSLSRHTAKLFQWSQKARSRLKPANPPSAASPGNLAGGQCARAATVLLGRAPSWRLGAGGLLPPPPSPPPTERSWQWAAPGRADSEPSPARQRGRLPGGRGQGAPRGGSALLVRCCANAGSGTLRAGLAAEPLRCAGPSDSSEGRSLRRAGAWPRTGASPFEASRDGRGPGSARFASGWHCVSHGGPVS